MKRILAGIAAFLLVAFGLVVSTAAPAQGDPPLTNCYPQLTTCGYPTSDTTGPRTGHTLTVCTALTSPACDGNGDLVITTNNLAVEDMEIRGCVSVRATGVT